MDHGDPHRPTGEELGRRSGAVLHLRRLCHPDRGHPPDHGGPLSLSPCAAVTLVRGGRGLGAGAVSLAALRAALLLTDSRSSRCLLSLHCTQGRILAVSISKRPSESRASGEILQWVLSDALSLPLAFSAPDHGLPDPLKFNFVGIFCSDI